MLEKLGPKQKVAVIVVGAGVGGFAAGLGSFLLYERLTHNSYIDLREELSLVKHELDEIRQKLEEKKERKREENETGIRRFVGQEAADGISILNRSESSESSMDNLAELTDRELDEYFDAAEWPSQVHFRLEPNFAEADQDSDYFSRFRPPNFAEEESSDDETMREDLSPNVEQKVSSSATMYTARSGMSSRTESFVSCESSSSGLRDLDGGNAPIDIRIVYERTDRWLNSGVREDLEKAYSLLQAVYNAAALEAKMLDAEFLWRFARVTFNYSQLFLNDKDRRKILVFEAKDYAFDALKLDPNNAEVHKWCALTLGTASSDFMGVSDKIRNGYDFKMHIDRALELRPNDAMLHYLSGRWSFGVASLSWLERKVASTLFAEPPTSTYQDALAEFLQAEKLSLKPWIGNKVFAAKCYIAIGSVNLALPLLEEAVKIQPNGPDESENFKEAREMLKKYGT